MRWAGRVEFGIRSGKIRIQFWSENLKIFSHLLNLGVVVWKILKPRKSAQAVNIVNYVGVVPRSNLHCPPRSHMQILCHGLQFYNYCFLPVIYVLLLTFKHLSPI